MKNGIKCIDVDEITLWTVDGTDKVLSAWHRIDGPAYMDFKYNDFGWYVNGNVVHTDAEFQQLANISDEEMCIMIIKYGSVR